MYPQGVVDALRRSETSTSDILIANVLAGSSRTLAGTFKGLLGHGGELILSGSSRARPAS